MEFESKIKKNHDFLNFSQNLFEPSNKMFRVFRSVLGRRKPLYDARKAIFLTSSSSGNQRKFVQYMNSSSQRI
tara:strand:- start:112 stop:330 length:219 start_codon:yes stop_codon:yes gene_type:complete